jgi:signal transduction histidine kinase
LALAVLVLALLWGGRAVYLQYDRSQALSNANRNGENLARAFAEHITSILRSIDQTLRSVVQDYEVAPATFDGMAAINKYTALSNATFQAVIIGADGYMVSSSLAASSERLYLGDREHFRVHAESDTSRLFISKPLIGRVSGRWSIQLSRRINRPDGSFGGVMLLSLDPQYLSNFYKSIDIGQSGLISVTGFDGIIRARATGSGDSEIGQDLTKSGLWRALAAAPNGRYQEASIVDGVERLFNYRTLVDYPLVINVGLATDDILAGYRQRRDLLIAGSILFTLIFAAAALLLLRQINLQLRTAAALQERERELIASRNEADLANRAKSEFLANMSHELRTPLNAIIGFSEFMASGALGPTGSLKYLDYAKDINRSGRHLLDMICDILDMSKIEAGQYELAFADIDIAPIAEFAVRLVAGRAEAGNLTLTNLVSPDLPKLRADERALRQILLNLLSNAVKFTPYGGQIAVTAAPDDDHMMALTVSDTGIGIAPANIGRVVQPFQQVGGILSRPHEGTGLGLAITKRLTELQGGSLSIQSELKKGTTVTVRLPMAAPVELRTAAAG